MSFAFSYYATIKNNLCLAYFGLIPEYVTQLRMAKTIFNQCFPELRIFIGARDEMAFLLDGEPDVIPFSEMEKNKYRFGYIRQIAASLQPPHSILTLLTESVPNPKYSVTKQPVNFKQCLICPDGALPTKSYANVGRLKAYAERAGFTTTVIGSDIHPGSAIVATRLTGSQKLQAVQKCDWVIGVENEYLFEAVRLGKKTTLVDTGMGADLYRLFCPGGEILQP